MVELTPDDVRAILQVVEGSDVDFLELQQGAFKLTVSKGSVFPVPAAASPVLCAPTVPAATAEVGAASDKELGEAPSMGYEVPLEPGLVSVNAPMVGTFYRASEPGAPPFVQPGDHVERGETLGLIEAMKLYTAITSPTAGTVVSVHADEGQFIEYGQEVFTLRVDK